MCTNMHADMCTERTSTYAHVCTHAHAYVCTACLYTDLHHASTNTCTHVWARADIDVLDIFRSAKVDAGLWFPSSLPCTSVSGHPADSKDGNEENEAGSAGYNLVACVWQHMAGCVQHP